MTTFRINIAVDVKNATVGTEKVSKSLKGVKTRADNARVSIGRMFTVLASISIVRRTVRSIADFEQAISTIEAVTGAATQQMKEMTDTARELGATTVFTATQAAEGLVLLSRAGFSANESMLAISDTLNLARAGGLGIARATEIAADTMRGFGIAAENTSRVVDVLALASSKANTTVEQLGQALKFTAPIARGLGVSIEETNAALSALADSGQKASIGGTGLRRVMAALESPTAKARNTLRSLGLEAKDVQVSSVGLTKALSTLASTGISTAEIFAIFGRRSGTAAQVLVSNIPKIREMQIALEGASGTAQRMSDIMGKNLNDALFKVTSAFNELRLSAGAAGFSDALTAGLRGLAATLRVTAQHGELVFGVLTALSVAVLSALIPAVVSLTAKMGLLNVSLLANPIIAGGAALIGLLAGISAGYSQLAASIEESNAGLAKDAELSKQGAQLRNIRKEQDLLISQGKRQGKLSDSQNSRLRKLLAAESSLVGALRKKNKAEQETLKALEQSKPTVDNLVRSLERQAEALTAVTDEQKLQIQVEDELRKLRTGQGQVAITPEDETKVQNAVAFLNASKEQAKVLKEVKGPALDAARRQKALNELLSRGAINTREYSEAISDLSGDLASIRDNQVFKEQADQIKKANDELRLRTQFSGVELQFRLELLKLGKEAGDLSSNQLAALIKEVTANKTLSDLLARQAAEAAKIAKSAEDKKAAEGAASARQTALLTEIGAIDSLVEKRKELLALAQEHPLAIEQIQVALDNLKLKGLEASTGLGDGFERAFIKMRNEANDFAAVGEDIANVFADQATNALTKFAETGKFAFKDFASSILKDITRIITRLLVVQAISAALGGGGGAPGLPGVSPTEPLFRAAGGSVQKDRSFIVGENGPELFTPGTKGNISPAGATAGMAQEAPQVNVQVVNVDDPEMVSQSISDGSSDEAIINVISRNRDKMKGIL